MRGEACPIRVDIQGRAILVADAKVLRELAQMVDDASSGERGGAAKRHVDALQRNEAPHEDGTKGLSRMAARLVHDARRRDAILRQVEAPATVPLGDLVPRGARCYEKRRCVTPDRHRHL